jgi:hypothetical protein
MGDERGPFYIASEQRITDFELIHCAAKAAKARGITVPTPQLIIRCLSLLIDSVPELRATAPSLTRDRARDIWADRWVVDSSLFRQKANWKSKCDLQTTLQSTHEFYVRSGLLKSRSRKT